MVLGELESYMHKNHNYFVTLYIKTNSKLMSDLNVRPKSIKLLEENIRSKYFDINVSNILWIYLIQQGKQKQK